jgi:3-hydroxybutyrate dehydrogenase
MRRRYFIAGLGFGAELGAMAVFLCSEAAAQILGAALPVDGAWIAQ